MKECYDPRFLKGIEEFNQRRFFECHETLEEIWWEEQGQDRLFYQGIIQIAVGYLKYKEGVLTGAIKLWHAGLEKIEAYPPVHLGIDLVLFIQGVAGDLKEIELAHEKGEGAPVLHAPRISLSA